MRSLPPCVHVLIRKCPFLYASQGVAVHKLKGVHHPVPACFQDFGHVSGMTKDFFRDFRAFTLVGSEVTAQSMLDWSICVHNISLLKLILLLGQTLSGQEQAVFSVFIVHHCGPHCFMLCNAPSIVVLPDL